MLLGEARYQPSRKFRCAIQLSIGEDANVQLLLKEWGLRQRATCEASAGTHDAKR
jgi:hypothetical protein